MKTRAEIERSFYQDKLYEYAYHAASNYFFGSEEGLWDSPGYRYFYEIQAGKVEFPFSKESYEHNTDIQNSLALIGLDAEKFWQAILYIYRLAFIRTVETTPVEQSVQERIQDLIAALSEDDTEVTIYRRGHNPSAIKDHDTKAFLALFLKHEDILLSALNNPEYTGASLLVDKEKKDIGVQWQIYDMYKGFKCIFDAFCQDKDLPKRVKGQVGSRDKMLLVSRILYFTKVVDDKKFLDSKDPIKSKLDKCENNPRPKVDDEFAN